MNRILIAEDETRLAAFIEKGLKKYGFFTAIAPDGTQALNMAQSGDFDLLLLDLGLPTLDGWTVLKQLRSQADNRPIIIVTAHADEKDRLMALAYGANDYVTKPFKFSELLERVQVHLSKEQL
ncbi:response regulator transcription factor [Synechocystis sp. PCC 7509]|uniref:response regulator transcription factor n=1 Tax=Synechocystis sp. PCC 7509 TaxID=927677 RepID=UPI0002ABBF11|nr:response regulator [Synechocystis sp. PCC 7509]